MKINPIFSGLFAGFLLMAANAGAETPLYFGWSSVAPHTADYDGDGHNELGLHDPSKGTMYARQINGTELAFDLTIAQPGFIAASADFDGDHKADPASYDIASGVLYAFLSTCGYQLGMLPCSVGTSTTTAKPADYDGDSKADPALYDSACGVWIILPSASGYRPVVLSFGGNGATAVPADYDGDGKADPCVYDQNTGIWSVLCSANHYALTLVEYGGPGCAAAPADFDGDRKADPTIYCSALGVWGTLNSASNYAPNIVIQGGPNCIAMPGNYYFANQADYAVWNATNGCWYITYNPLGGFFSGLFCSFFKSLVKGAGSKYGGAIAGWTLNDIFGADPADPHWAETMERLNEMNHKLDDLLAGQQVITNMLMQLSQQLEYDKNEIEWFVSQCAANNAIAIIESHYDQHGIDGYASFYQCDTNQLPTPENVDYFANIVLGSTYNMKTAVDSIYRAVIPATGNTNGVLRLWANMAKPTLTPDNLMDNFNALAYYFATMYNYQMKGAAMYVDASRVRGTSEWALAATANYITNDLTQMVQEELNEFRNVTYDYIMTAIKAVYNPASTNNPMLVTNVAEVLARQTFFSRQWLARDETLNATFLTINRPETMANYQNITAVSQPDGAVLPPQAVVTNWVTSRTYGYANPDLQHITVRNDYAFLCNDFGQVPAGNYVIYNPAGYNFGSVTVSNYTDSMEPATNSAVTNLFGHLYASPYNLVQLSLPLDTSYWWDNRWNYVSYYAGTQPSHRDCWYQITNPSSITNFYMKALMYYDMRGGWHNPSGLGVWPWDFALVYPLVISNCAAASVNARAFFTVEDACTVISRWDHHGAWNTEWWSFHDCGGFANFHSADWAHWSWPDAYRNKFNTGQTTPETHTSSTNRHNGMAQADISGTSTTTAFYVGGQLYVQEDCWEGAVTPGFVPCYVQGEIQFKIKQVVLSFY